MTMKRVDSIRYDLRQLKKEQSKIVYWLSLIRQGKLAERRTIVYLPPLVVYHTKNSWFQSMRWSVKKHLSTGRKHYYLRTGCLEWTLSMPLSWLELQGLLLKFW